MIVFIELEPFESSHTFTPTRQRLVPVHMIKDGNEYFVCNMPIAGGSYTPEYNRQVVEGYKAQLIRNNGTYFKFYGFYDDPEEMIDDIIRRDHTFTVKEDLFLDTPPETYGAGFTTFGGNRNEVSAAFHYRIFCPKYAAILRERVKPIIKKKGGKKDD